MAIALDTSTDGSNATATSLTFAHTCTGSNLLLFVLVYAATDVVTGVTYNGVAMTQVTKVSGGGGVLYLYALFAPATGANNVVISASSSGVLEGMSASYTGSQQSVTMDAFASLVSNGISSGAWTGVTNTVVASNCWQINGAIKTGSGIPSAANNCTTRKNAAAICLCDSNGTVATGARSQAVNASDGSQNWAHIAASFGPYVAPTVTYSYGSRGIRSRGNLQNIQRLG